MAGDESGGRLTTEDLKVINAALILYRKGLRERKARDEILPPGFFDEKLGDCAALIVKVRTAMLRGHAFDLVTTDSAATAGMPARNRAEFACRRCGECRDSAHHWLSNPDFGDDPADADGPTDYPYQCKHCPALGRDCDECGGPDCGPADEAEDDAPPCPGCDGSGVAFLGWFIPRTLKED